MIAAKHGGGQVEDHRAAGLSRSLGRCGAQGSAEVDADRGRERRVQHEIERLTDATAQMSLSPALAERLRKAEADRDALNRARTRSAVSPLPSAIRAQIHALVTGLDIALRADVARTRDALRAMLGDAQLIDDNGSVYAECDSRREALACRQRTCQ